MEWEKIFANRISDKGLIPRRYTIIKQTNKNLIFKWTKDLNRHFSKKDIQMASGYMKKYST